jgi:hypothetical protein
MREHRRGTEDRERNTLTKVFLGKLLEPRPTVCNLGPAVSQRRARLANKARILRRSTVDCGARDKYELLDARARPPLKAFFCVC